MSELISVIIPVYNVKEYLEKCVDSVLGQTYRNLEIILVDDGSSDGSETICDTYAQKDNRVVVIHKKNEGAAAARNAGLNVAKGKYIGFVDSDDWAEPEMYETLYALSKETNADISFCVNERVYRKKWDNELSGETIVLEGADILTSFVEPTYRPHILKAVWDKLFTREIISDVRFRIGQHEDGDFNTKVLCKAQKVAFTGKVLYHYLDERPGSVTNTGISERIFADRLPVLFEQIQDLKKAGREDLASRQEVMYYAEMLSYYLKIFHSSHEKRTEYLERITGMIREHKNVICKTFGYPQASKGYQIQMRLFFVSPALYRVYKKIRK